TLLTCDHSFTEYVSDKNGNCTENGTMTAYCDKGCGTTDTVEEPDSLIHNFTLDVLIAPTCKKTGLGLNVCSCGVYESVSISPVPHLYTEYSYNGDATCTADGTKTASCDYGCGNTDTITDEGTMLPHVYTSYSYNGDATCTADGTKSAYCDYGCTTVDTLTDEGTMIPHVYTDYVSNNDGDCYNDCTGTASCDYGCGNTDTVTLPDTKIHEYQYSVATAPTCMTEGVGLYLCECPEQYTEPIATVDHVYTEYIYNGDATCMADGTKTASCDFGCGNTDTVTDEGTLCGHRYENYIYNGDATCIKDGTETSECYFGCGNTDTRTAVGTMLDHSYTEEILREPDCINEGAVLYMCSCGKYYYDILPTVDHSFSDWVITVPATETETGVEERICSVCKETETRELPMVDTGIPAITTNNYMMYIDHADDIKDIRYAKGVYTTTTEIRNAEGNVAISSSLVEKGTVEGVYSYEMPSMGTYSLWVRMKDGTNYILSLEIKDITTTVTSYGVKITLNDIRTDIKDYFIAKGEYNTYNELKANGYIVNISANKIGTKHSYTYTVSEPGVHTVLIRYTDGSFEVFHHELTVDTPVFTENGLQVTVSNIPDVRIIRTAPGRYTTASDVKNAGGCRNYSNKSVINNAESYKLQYRDEGWVTIAVEYNNGYQYTYQYYVQSKKPAFTRDANVITFGGLEGMNVLRYAKGVYSTSSEIKAAEGSVA
ncbi:MAG: hypothetical protein IKU19_08220, partial [Clostridia bacterium]|nr:hypothetical protein [Clostridia bacterium]